MYGNGKYTSTYFCVMVVVGKSGFVGKIPAEVFHAWAGIFFEKIYGLFDNVDLAHFHGGKSVLVGFGSNACAAAAVHNNGSFRQGGF